MQLEFCEIMAAVEAILFVAGDPVNVRALAHSMNLTAPEMEEALDRMARAYADAGRGIRLNRNGGEAYLSINPACAGKVEAFLQPLRRQPLSQAALETLSVIAYRQPATKAEMEAVRGVKCDYSVQFLIRRGLIEECGRRETLGRPIEYRTTDKFLMHFGIESLAQLPDINELGPAAPEDEGAQGPFQG